MATLLRVLTPHDESGVSGLQSPALQKLWAEMVNALDPPTVDSLCDGLYSKDILSHNQLKELTTYFIGTPKEKARSLLHLLIVNDTHTKAFATLLCETDEWITKDLGQRLKTELGMLSRES
jgi:hypothetical protein